MPEKTPRDKEAQIVDAARRRFSYFGFSKVTMDEIAADVGLGKGSLYYYFPTKVDLFRHVLVHDQDRFEKEIRALLALDLPASQKLTEYVDRRLKRFNEYVSASNAGQAWIEAGSSPRELGDRMHTIELKLLREIFAEGKRNGEFAISDVRQTAVLFHHALHGFRLRALSPSGGPLPDRAAQKLLREDTRLFTHAFLHGILKARGQSAGTEPGEKEPNPGQQPHAKPLQGKR